MSEPESQGVTRRTVTVASSPPSERRDDVIEIRGRDLNPRSGERPNSDETTTLLSAPSPASSFEIETEDRLTRLELELSLLRGRLDSVEAQERMASSLRQPAQHPDDAHRARSDASLGAGLDTKQWRVVVVWVLGLALLAAYGLLK